MYYKVKIKKLGQAAEGKAVKTGQQTSDGALAIQPTAWGGSDITGNMGEKDLEVTESIGAVDKKDANLEAEGGETAYGDINGDGMAEHYKIKGPRHTHGGVPLNLPDDTFIFSDTRSMMIKDRETLAKFGKSTSKGKKPKGYTPAELAKQYDINKYRKILQDKNSDAIDKKTAELMIRNYTLKLAELGLRQEAQKGFPQGIAKISQPYLEANGLSEEDILPTYQKRFPDEESMANQEEPQLPEEMPTEMPSGEQIAMSPEMMGEAPMAKYGMAMGGYNMPFWAMEQKGNLAKAQKGVATPPYSMKEAYTPKGVVRLNQFRAQYGLPPLKGSVTEADIKRAAGELQAKITEVNPALTIDYMTTKSHQPNNKLLPLIPDGYPKTTEGAKQALADGALSADDIRSAYKDDQWWYRAVRTEGKKLSREEYEKKMKDPNAITQGDRKYFSEDPNNPDLYTYYDPMDPEAVVEEEETVKEGERPEEEEFNPQVPYQAPLEWTTPDKRNLFGAVAAKYNRRKYYPYAPMVDLAPPAPTFYDPTAELAAQQAGANSVIQGLASFVGPQALSSRASSVAGTSAGAAAETLAKYNNLNVGVANQFADTTANTYNQERLQNQAVSKQLYDDTVKTNQAWDTGTQGYNAMALAMLNAGDQNAANIYNLSSMSDQYGIDPATLAYYSKGGKDFVPEKGTDTYNELLDYYENERGYSTDQAIAAAKESMKYMSQTPGIDLEAVMANAKDGGVFVMGSNIFPPMFY